MVYESWNQIALLITISLYMLRLLLGIKIRVLTTNFWFLTTLFIQPYLFPILNPVLFDHEVTWNMNCESELSLYFHDSLLVLLMWPNSQLTGREITRINQSRSLCPWRRTRLITRGHKTCKLPLSKYVCACSINMLLFFNCQTLVSKFICFAAKTLPDSEA